MRWSRWCLLFVVACSTLSFAQNIPPPRRGMWILDRTGKVSSGIVGQVNTLAANLDASGAGQLGVLITDTTQGQNPRSFATSIFNSWGVGHHGVNDGVLIFFALSDRKSEIVLGDGSKLSSSQTDVVMRDDIVANMKQQRLDQAVLQAAVSIDRLLRQASGTATPNPNDNTGLGPDAYVTPRNDVNARDEKLAAYAEGSTSFPEHSPRSWVVDLGDLTGNSERASLDVAASDVYASNQGRIFFLLVKHAGSYPTIDDLAARFVRQVRPLSKLPAAVVAIDPVHGTAVIHLPEGVVTSDWDRLQVDNARMELTATMGNDRLGALVRAQQFAQTALTTGIPPRPMGVVLEEGYERNKGFFGFGALGLLIGGIAGFRRWNRNRVRMCEDCNVPRARLNEFADDKHLSPGQRTEENLGSVDYDVWLCERCSDALVLRYGAFFTAYSGCTSCGNKTLKSNSTVVTPATEWSSGTRRIDEKCAHCNYSNSYTRSIPRIVRSESSSSSSWSSSSSSGSSFGGGSSSGGGSSGSW